LLNYSITYLFTNLLIYLLTYLLTYLFTLYFYLIIHLLYYLLNYSLSYSLIYLGFHLFTYLITFHLFRILFFKYRFSSWFNLLDLFHAAGLGAKVSGAQMDAWLAFWKLIRETNSRKRQAIYGSRFFLLCVKMNRPDLLEREKPYLFRVLNPMDGFVTSSAKEEILRLMQESKLQFADTKSRDEFVKLLSTP